MKKAVAELPGEEVTSLTGEKSPLRSKPQLTGEQTAQACEIACFRQLYCCATNPHCSPTD
jgi:hypothetical protein